MQVIGNNGQLSDGANFCKNERLNNIVVANAGTLNILKNLEINNVHVHDNSSIKILKLCGDLCCR